MFRRSFPLSALLLITLLSIPADAQERPNVLLIYTDDQGTIDLNCYGAEDLITPNLDALAAGGVRFTQMYAPSAICSSSRAGLMTGRYQQRFGHENNPKWVSEYRERRRKGKGKDRWLPPYPGEGKV